MNGIEIELRAIREQLERLKIEPKHYSEIEAADELQIKPLTLQRLRRAGKIGFVVVGGRYRYLGRHLTDFLEMNAHEPIKKGPAK